MYLSKVNTELFFVGYPAMLVLKETRKQTKLQNK